MKPSHLAPLVALACVLLSCGGHQREGTSAAAVCLADEIGALELSPSIPSCSSRKVECELRCRLGEAGACLGIAYLAEKSSSPGELQGLYRRACLRGAAN